MYQVVIPGDINDYCKTWICATFDNVEDARKHAKHIKKITGTVVYIKKV